MLKDYIPFFLFSALIWKPVAYSKWAEWLLVVSLYYVHLGQKWRGTPLWWKWPLLRHGAVTSADQQGWAGVVCVKWSSNWVGTDVRWGPSLQKPTKSIHELSLSALSRAVRHGVGRNCGHSILYLRSQRSWYGHPTKSRPVNCEDFSLITGKSFQDTVHLSFMQADLLSHRNGISKAKHGKKSGSEILHWVRVLILNGNTGNIGPWKPY